MYIYIYMSVRFKTIQVIHPWILIHAHITFYLICLSIFAPPPPPPGFPPPWFLSLSCAHTHKCIWSRRIQHAHGYKHMHQRMHVCVHTNPRSHAHMHHAHTHLNTYCPFRGSDEKMKTPFPNVNCFLQLYEDAVEMQMLFIKTRDELCKNGEMLLTPALSYTERHLQVALEAEKREKLPQEQKEEEEKKRSGGEPDEKGEDGKAVSRLIFCAGSYASVGLKKQKTVVVYLGSVNSVLCLNLKL